jgi:hypothetical protein
LQARANATMAALTTTGAEVPIQAPAAAIEASLPSLVVPQDTSLMLARDLAVNLRARHMIRNGDIQGAVSLLAEEMETRGGGFSPPTATLSMPWFSSSRTMEFLRSQAAAGGSLDSGQGTAAGQVLQDATDKM